MQEPPNNVNGAQTNPLFYSPNSELIQLQLILPNRLAEKNKCG